MKMFLKTTLENEVTRILRWLTALSVCLQQKLVSNPENLTCNSTRGNMGLVSCKPNFKNY